jgi:DNA-binding NarL/FixJ family response regulator
MAQIKIILAEPSFLLRKGMIELISELEEFSIVKEIENKSLLSDGIENANPDLIIINPEYLKKKIAGSPFLYSCRLQKKNYWINK